MTPEAIEDTTSKPTALRGGEPSAPLLEIRNLSISYRLAQSTVLAADDVSFSVGRGEILGIVGESGSGKTTVIRSIIRLLREPPAEVSSGEIWFDGRDLLRLGRADMRALRGARISLIFQDPFASLNPCLHVGKQIAESLRYRGRMSRSEARDRVVEVMTLVGIPDARRRLSAYPAELSGGLRQRVGIASALTLSPDLVLADEPTTALDVTIQKQILILLRKLRDELGMSFVIVTHDLGVVAQTCDRVIVMYAGRVVEVGPADQILRAPAHPYTKALIAAIPRGVGRDARIPAIPGAPPSLAERPEGCAFAPRCALAQDACSRSVPPLALHSPERWSACLRHAELD
jgi:oligopeptide/dipeptide ABC transporter ATP-binding protein